MVERDEMLASMPRLLEWVTHVDSDDEKPLVEIWFEWALMVVIADLHATELDDFRNGREISAEAASARGLLADWAESRAQLWAQLGYRIALKRSDIPLP